MVTAPTERNGVELEADLTGTRFLRAVLARACAAFPEQFAGCTVPADDATFRARLAEIVPQFEAARSVCAERAEIARLVYLEAASRLQFVDAEGPRSLQEALREPCEPLPLVRIELPGSGTLRPCAEFRGRLYEGAHVAELARELYEAHLATRAAADALSLVAERADALGGLSLASQRFVLIGAGAELSPVYALLEAGAEVLWLDLHNPPIDHLLEPRLGGVLHYVEGGADLLARPAALRATIDRFAERGPVHVGLYAFAPGGAREMRLALTAVELARALDPARIASLLFLLSPTSASPLSPEDAATAEERRKAASTVQRALMLTGPLAPGHVVAGEARISCAVVAQQGGSYQTAEYVAKRLAAEALFEFGSGLDARAPGSLAVSVNMVPITETRSMASPLLEAALLGAPKLEMLIASPSTARAVSSLLTVHDVLAREADPALLSQLPREERARALFARQFHGGVYAQPFALEGVIRMAALRGITQRPKLAFELLR